MKTLRGWLIFWSLFIALGAIFGAVMMFFDITGVGFGMESMLPYFQKLPFAESLFQDFLIPGIALLLANGVTNLVAFYLLIRKSKYSGIVCMCCGIILVLWICVQFYILPFNLMSTAFFLFGIIEAISGYLLFHKQNKQTIDTPRNDAYRE